MPRSWVATVRVLAALGLVVLVPLQAATPGQPAAPGWAASAGSAGDAVGLKPGLWDVRVIRQVVDGRDESQQVNASLARAQQLLASLPPVQRARLQALLSHAGVAEGSQGSFRVCVSPQMARENLPLLDREGHCHPVVLRRTATHVDFRFRCTGRGTSLSGSGRAELAADLVTSRTDVLSRAAGGATHTIHSQMQMRYLSADCGGLKPPGS